MSLQSLFLLKNKTNKKIVTIIFKQKNKSPLSKVSLFLAKEVKSGVMSENAKKKSQLHMSLSMKIRVLLVRRDKMVPLFYNGVDMLTFMKKN